MCGIAGILHFDGRPVEPQSINRMSSMLEHRGRDSYGIVFGSAARPESAAVSKTTELALAHRRLSIIDLSPSSAQPMSYAGSKLWLTYNGEIYNYLEIRDELVAAGFEFRTRSDSEVILAAYAKWGKECVKRFNGMFAFALWDEHRQVLFCARDHIGIKPFYYVLTPKRFAFASESRPLADFTSASISEDGVRAYLLCMYVPGPWSMYEGIRKLPPATTMAIYADGRVETDTYWHIDRFGGQADGERQIENLIDKAVKRQLQSDVPVGALLSGGLDSGIITAFASRHINTLHTFSIGYEGLESDERENARSIAQKYGTIHHEYFVGVEDVRQSLDAVLEFMDEPIADTAALATSILSKMAASNGVKVLLSGTGGDEVFGGYLRHAQRTILRKVLSRLPGNMVAFLADLFLRKGSIPQARLKMLGLDMVINAGGCPALVAGSFSESGGFGAFAARMEEACFPKIPPGIPHTYKLMYFDLKVYLADELLMLMDKVAMAWTIEGRVPLLDIELVEAAYRLNADIHIRGERTKQLLRNIAKPHLGDAIANGRKLGFGGPMEYWVKNQRARMLEVINELSDLEMLKHFNIDAYVKRHDGGDPNGKSAVEIFRLYCLAKWYLRNVKKQ